METRAIVLDVGGVLLLPDPDLLAAALTAAGVTYDADALGHAHYGGVAALDATPDDWPAGGAPGRYLEGLVAAAGVPNRKAPAAIRALRDVFERPSIEVWRQPTPWARTGLGALETLGLPVAVVSNADGTVEDQLALHELAQIGPGPGLPVVAIVDSAVVGTAKPSPEVFTRALQALDVPAEHCLYVGDTVTYDVAGARAAGLRPVHLDPLGACILDDHPHARDLASALPAPRG